MSRTIAAVALSWMVLSVGPSASKPSGSSEISPAVPKKRLFASSQTAEGEKP